MCIIEIIHLLGFAPALRCETYVTLYCMKRRFTEDSWRKEPWFKGLVQAMLSCKSDEDMSNFLRDISTLSELQALSERLEVARLLARGMSYRQIAKETGASTTTVTRVANFVENGEGGYRKVLGTHRHHRMNADVKQAGPKAESAPEETPPHTEQARHVSPLQKYLDRK
jgi:TrpR-related protein YerC/YecD